MPPTWKWLCCVRKKLGISTREEKRQRRLLERQNKYRVDDKDATDNYSPRKLQPVPDQQFARDTKSLNATDNDSSSTEDRSWVRRLQEEQKTTKRRRVEEIFNQSSLSETDLSKPMAKKKLGFKQSRSFSESETMHAYVPRAVQGVYVSTTLEGYSAEDYLRNYRQVGELDKFSNSLFSPSRRASEPAPRSIYYQREAEMLEEPKVSRVIHEENCEDNDSAFEGNTAPAMEWLVQTDIKVRESQTSINDSSMAEHIFGCEGEVLY